MGAAGFSASHAGLIPGEGVKEQLRPDACCASVPRLVRARTVRRDTGETFYWAVGGRASSRAALS